MSVTVQRPLYLGNVSYSAGGTVSCKKKDVLALQLTTYKDYSDDLCKGFSIAEKLLQEERIFSSRDLPCSTIPGIGPING